MSEIKQIEPNKWEEFLEAFSERNKNRRARFQLFRGASAEEEAQEAHLETVSVKDNGDKTDVVVVRTDLSNAAAEKLRDIITNVRGIAVQYDTDGSEDILEIADEENELVILRLESKVDGAS